MKYINQRLLKLTFSTLFPFALTVLLGFGGGLMTIFQAQLLSRIISQVFLFSWGLERVNKSLLILLGVIIIRALLAFFAEYSAGYLAVQIKTSLRNALAHKIFSAGPALLQQEQSGELSAVLMDGVEAVDAYFSRFLPQLCLAALVPALILVIVFPMDLLTGLVLVVTGPLIPIFMGLIGSTAEKLTHQQWTTLSRMSAQFLDAVQGLATLKVFNRSKEWGKQVQAASEQYRIATMKVLRVTFLSALVLELVSTISTAVVAVEVGLRLLYGQMEFEQALFILIIAPEFYLPMRNLGLRFHAAMSGVSASNRIFALLDMPFVNQEEIDPKKELDWKLSGPLSIEFQHINYVYPNRTEKTLEDISFTLSSGQVTSLVGRSGSGKSTALQILLRFLEQQSGQILVNGAPLETIPLSEWRKLVAWVPQQPVLFQGSILENICLGRPHASQEEVNKAANLAHLEEFIKGLPKGYETPVGEGGARLSGGQVQRLALARAYLMDAPLLILDEPTAHLDPEQENLLAETIQAVTANRTVLMIAHSLATICNAGEILVFDHGRIVERGVHEDLKRLNGHYARMLCPTGGVEL
jgi:ATP-binding cassette, subfamily C, bacterial CydD